MSFKWSAYIIGVLLLAAICNAAEQSVSENQITITSDKEAYQCEPIYNEKGQCLIRATIKIQYLAPEPSTISVKSEFTTDIKEPNYAILATSNADSVAVIAKDSLKADKMLQDIAISQEAPIKEEPIDLGGKVIIGEELKGDILAAEAVKLSEPLAITKQDEYTTDVLDVQPTDTQIIQMEFWADKDGKFNIVVENGEVKTILDPTYSIGISAQNPAWLLEGGDVDVLLGIDEYNQKTNITSIITDNNTATSTHISVGEKLYPDLMRFYYRFNNPSLTNLVDDNAGENDMTRLVATNITKQQDFYSMGVNNAANAGGIVITNPNLLLPSTDFTYCMTWNSTQTLTNGVNYYLMSVASSGNQSYTAYLTQQAGNPRVVCQVSDDNDAGTLRAAIGIANSINNGSIHTICCRRNIANSTLQTIVDGTPIASIGSVDAGVSTIGNLIVSGWQIVGNQGLYGYMDEFALWTTGLTNTETTRRTFYNNTNGSAVQIFFNYTSKTHPNYHYTLKILSNVSYPSVLRVYSMINQTHINLSNYMEQSINSGENLLDIDSIAGTGYNSPFRIITSKTKNVFFSDISLIETANDSIQPHIENCFVNDSNVDCDDSVEWGCSVYDNESDVATATGVVSFGGLFPLIQNAYRDPTNLTKWSVKLTAAEVHALLVGQGWTFNISVPNYLSFVNASDLAGNVAYNITSSPSNIYSCIEHNCSENWVESIGSCSTNDTQLKTYTDSNNCNTTITLPLDNGTYTACNFCSQTIMQVIGGCFNNGTANVQNTTYTDTNYFGCCALTGLFSDCSINYAPYNETSWAGCVNSTLQFMVNHPASCEFDLKGNDKCFFQFDLNRTGTWNCLSTIRTLTNELIQTNPTYTAKANTLITLGSSDYEDRKYFEVVNGLGVAYFTKENLVIDGRDYIFSIECSNGTNRLQSDITIPVEYANINEPLTRLPFLGNNAAAIVGIILGVIILFILAAWAWRLSK